MSSFLHWLFQCCGPRREAVSSSGWSQRFAKNIWGESPHLWSHYQYPWSQHWNFQENRERCYCGCQIQCCETGANPFHLLAEPTVCERHLVRRIGNASTRLHLWKHYVQTCVRHWICPCSLTITTNVSSLHLFFSSGSCLATIINHQKQRKAENKKQKQTNK